MDLPGGIRASLTEQITHSTPCGPIKAASYSSDISPFLFYKETKTYRNYTNPDTPRPTFLIFGRRGIGKTTIIRDPGIGDRYEVVVRLEGAEAATVYERGAKTAGWVADELKERPFNGVASSVADLVTALETDSVELVSEFWMVSFWTLLMARLMEQDKHFSGRKTIYRYLAGLLGSPTVEPDNTTLLYRITSRIGELARSGEVDSIAAFRRYSTHDSECYNEAENACRECLSNLKLRAVVFVDTIEDLHLQEKPNWRLAISGLIRFLSEPMGNGKVHICVCFPTELREDLQTISRNTGKDLSSAIIISWTPEELRALFARRLHLYLSLYFQDHDRLAREFSPMMAADIIEVFFPRQITNRLNTEEPTWNYLLRHTQNNPRHLFIITNSIFEVLLRNENRVECKQIDRDVICEGVLLGESIVVDEIINSYAQSYPELRQLCRAILGRIERVFTESDLDTTFSREKGSIPVTMDIGNGAEAIQLLYRVGAIGRVVKITPKYVEAEFEYTSSAIVVRNPGAGPKEYNHLYAVHPAFCSVFKTEESTRSEYAKRIVYPRGVVSDFA